VLGHRPLLMSTMTILGTNSCFLQNTAAVSEKATSLLSCLDRLEEVPQSSNDVLLLYPRVSCSRSVSVH
jgi:hypothetical protein